MNLFPDRLPDHPEIIHMTHFFDLLAKNQNILGNDQTSCKVESYTFIISFFLNQCSF